VSDGLVGIRAIKRRFPLGALNPDDAADLHLVFSRWLPDLEPSSLAVTSLSNINNLIHPPVVLANAARIELAEPFLLYRQGMSRSTARLIEAIDQERLEILATLDQPAIPLAAWLQRFYGDQGLAGADLGEMLTGFAPWAAVHGPTLLDHRFLTEDVDFGLAPLEAIGIASGVATPTLSSLLTTLSRMTTRDMRVGATVLAERLLAVPRGARTSL
jgi:hypothetical protein